MLVLARKKEETIVIDGNIEIKVLQIKGNTIRLGVTAPRDVRVLRGELKPFGMENESPVVCGEPSNPGVGYDTEIETLVARAG